MTTWIVIALYWIACCISVYVMRNKKSKNSLRKITNQKTKLLQHLVIVLLCPIAVPIILLALAFKACQKLYYKNRPRPLPKKLKKYMKKDCVLKK